MEIGINKDGRIYVETMEYSGTYMQNIPCQRFITIEEATCLKRQLDWAILVYEEGHEKSSTG